MRPPFGLVSIHSMKPTFIRIVFFVLLSFSSALLTGCGESKPKVDVAAQIRALDGNTEAKQEALTQLGTQGKGALPALDKLIELLKDPDPIVRRLSAYAIGEIGPDAKKAVPALKAAMDNADREFGTSLVNALRAVDLAAAKSMGL